MEISPDRLRGWLDGFYGRHDGALEMMATPFYRRDRLPLEQSIAGPAIVLQTDSTTVVPPGTTLIAEIGGNLILTIDQ